MCNCARDQTIGRRKTVWQADFTRRPLMKHVEDAGKKVDKVYKRR